MADKQFDVSLSERSVAGLSDVPSYSGVDDGAILTISGGSPDWVTPIDPSPPPVNTPIPIYPFYHTQATDGQYANINNASLYFNFCGCANGTYNTLDLYVKSFVDNVNGISITVYDTLTGQPIVSTTAVLTNAGFNNIDIPTLEIYDGVSYFIGISGDNGNASTLISQPADNNADFARRVTGGLGATLPTGNSTSDRAYYRLRFH